MKTFKDAVMSYVKFGGEEKYFPKILEHWSDYILEDICTFDVKELMETHFSDWANSTKQRQLIVPIRCALNHAQERGWIKHSIKMPKIKLEKKKKKKDPASNVWLALFLRECDRRKRYHIAALVLFMNHTGARVSEAINLKWEDVDLEKRKVILKKTKTDTNIERFLTDELIRRITYLETKNYWKPNVFKYTNRHSVNESIKFICGKADIEYKSSHECGRHSFATNTIRYGCDIKSTMIAGGWKSTNMFMDVYVHSKNAGRKVADAINMKFMDDI